MRLILGAGFASIVPFGSITAAAAGCVVGVSDGNALNVRGQPFEAATIRGALPANQCGIAVSQTCERNWCKVSFKGLSGWASMKFLDRDRTNQPTSVKTDRANNAEPSWVLLGARGVNLALDRDVIPVGQREGRFTALRLHAKDNGIFIRDLVVTYANGVTDRIPVQYSIGADRQSKTLDLAGSKRYIQQVSLNYRTVPGAEKRAEVLVFGLRGNSTTQTVAQRETGQPVNKSKSFTPPSIQVSWEVLGERVVRFGRDVDTITVGRGGGTFSAIQLVVKDTAIRIDDLKVRYGNGSVDELAVREQIPAGGRTRVLDLEGRYRFIKDVVMSYGSRGPISAPARVTVYGLRVRRLGNLRRAKERMQVAGWYATDSIAVLNRLGAVRQIAKTESGVSTKVGTLGCIVEGGTGFIFGSTKNLRCNFDLASGRTETYVGTISRFGLDVGTTSKGVLIWGVLAATNDVLPGALVGDYSGVAAQATVGAVFGANALIGGSNNTIALQPLSVQVQQGVNLAAGIAALALRLQ